MPHIDKHAPGEFCWIELATIDQIAAKRFYSTLFDWTVAEFPMPTGETYTIFKKPAGDAASAYVMRPDERAQIPPHWNLYVAVENADEAASRVTELGGKVIEGPFDVSTFGRMAVIQDPTGAFFCVWQAKQSTGITVLHEPGTLCWADLNTPDPARAKTFYEALLGWKLAAGEADPGGYLHIMNGESFIGGVPPAGNINPQVPPHWLAYFSVADVDEATAKATSLGGTVHLPPMTVPKVGRMAVLADPQGASFAIFQPS